MSTNDLLGWICGAIGFVTFIVASRVFRRFGEDRDDAIICGAFVGVLWPAAVILGVIWALGWLATAGAGPRSPGGSSR